MSQIVVSRALLRRAAVRFTAVRREGLSWTALPLLLTLGWTTAVLAQNPAPAAPAEPAADGAGSTTTTTYVPYGRPAPGTDINEYLPSSSRPMSGDQQDTFDLNRRGGGGATLHGNENGVAVFADGTSSSKPVPRFHSVKRGDTLWSICTEYYDSPWKWPQVWANNPQLQNPNWIYPGDQLRLAPSGQGPAAVSASGPIGSRLGGVRRGVRPGTVFVPDRGFIGDPSKEQWGSVVGSHEEQMMLSTGNTVYMRMADGHDPSAGEVIPVYSPVRPPDGVPGARNVRGEIVAVKGRVKVTYFDPETRIARGIVAEATDVIERGDRVGPVAQEFLVVEQRPTTKEVRARVLTAFYPFVHMGRDQFVLVDRGKNDGLEVGVELLVLRRGDTWRNTLSTASSSARYKLRMEVHESVSYETTPLEGSEADFPDEVVARLRVVRVQDDSAVTLVVESEREIVSGDRAVAVPGR